MGSPAKSGESASSAANDEWIELRNNAGRAVSLAGWQLISGNGKIKILFSAGDDLPAGSFFLLERGSAPTVPGVAADKLYTGSLANDGDTLFLIDNQCLLSDAVLGASGWPAGDSATRQTMERDVTDLAWHTSAQPGGTPGAQNSTVFVDAGTSNNAGTNNSSGAATDSNNGNSSSGLSSNNNAPVSLPGDDSSGSDTTTSSSPSSSDSSSGASSSAPSSVATQILIARVQIAGAKTDNDFITLYNPGNTSVSLVNWKLRKRTQPGTESSIKALSAGDTIAAHSFFTWANSEDAFDASMQANVSSTQTLSANNSIGLLDEKGTLIDALAWGTGETNPYVEGTAYPENPAANKVLTRKILDGVMQNTNNNSTDFDIE